MPETEETTEPAASEEKRDPRRARMTPKPVDNFPTRSRTRRLQRRNTRALLGVSREEIAKMDLVVERTFVQHCVVGYEEVDIPTGKLDDEGNPILRMDPVFNEKGEPALDADGNQRMAKPQKQVLEKITCVPGQPLPKELLEDPNVDLRLLLKRGWVLGDVPSKTRTVDPLVAARQAKQRAGMYQTPKQATEEAVLDPLDELRALSLDDSKAELQAALSKHGIAYSNSDTKSALLELVAGYLGEGDAPDEDLGELDDELLEEGGDE